MGVNMIPRSGRIWMRGLGLTGLVLLAACSQEKRPAAAVAPSAAPAAAVAAAPVRPEGADAVDQAVVEMQLFTATASESLADIAAAEASIKALTAKALDAARRIDSVPAGQQPALARAYAGAMADRDAAHARLAASLEAFRTTSAETSAIVQAALPSCAGAAPAPPVVPAAPPAPGKAAAAAAPAPAPPPPSDGTLATYPGCGILLRDQADLGKTVANLSTAFESAEVAYRADRRRMDEAAATIALAR